MKFIFAQILGVIALTIVCISYFVKKKSTFFIIQIVANFFYAAAFLVLDVFVGGLITMVSLVRGVCFYFCEKKDFAYTYIFLPIFFTAYLIIGIVFFETWVDIIPIITATLFTIAFFVKRIEITRCLMLLPNVMILIYNILNLTYSNALLDLIEIIVIIIAIIKFQNDKKNKKIQQNC